MTNLGTLNGDDCSIAFHINSKGQIVGNSFPCAGGRSHAFLWQNGFMTDLNALLPPGSGLTPWGDGAFINDRGDIAGVRVLPDGDLHAVLLIPCDEEHANDSECEDEGEGTAVGRGETNQRPNVVLPENVHKMLRQRLGSRYHIPGIVASPRD